MVSIGIYVDGRGVTVCIRGTHMDTGAYLWIIGAYMGHERAENVRTCEHQAIRDG